MTLTTSQAADTLPEVAPAPADLRGHGEDRSLAWYLSLFAFGLAVPTLVFVGVLLWGISSAERARIETDARGLARTLAVAIDREVAGVTTTLQALSTAPTLGRGDLAAFYEQMMEVRTVQNYHLSLRNTSGVTVLATRLPFGQQITNNSDIVLGADKEAIGTGRPQVSDVFIGPVNGLPTLQIVVPTRNDASEPYVLGASLDPVFIRQALTRFALPQDWLASVVDRRGVFVARSARHDTFVGKPASATFRSRADGERGLYYGTTSDGTASVVAYDTASVSGWRVAVSGPQAIANEAIRRSVLTFLALGALLGLVALLLARIIRGRILGAMGELQASAQALSKGLAVTPPRTRVREVDEVGHAFALASADLLRTRAELQGLNATLERRVEEAVGERESAEAQLRQAQKMEAVGQLTGGVAHDFNNLLTVVSGNLDLLRRRLGNADERSVRNLDNALEGTRRAAALTTRLLAFSRQSPLQPQVLDCNKLVAGMSDLLGRTLGETIQVESVLAGGLWRCEADQNGLESAILNLAVNARDAMPAGGKLTIETANAYLDEAYAASAPEAPKPGQYVMISVSDTGAGMMPDIVARVFEPFFTTKPVGKGTGLGLSQVYGFARQSGGHAAIYSEPGQGTTVKIYLPRLPLAHDRGPVSVEGAATSPHAPALGRGETVLVVEDEPMVREFTTAVLEEAGYRVLVAHDGPSAIALLDRHGGEIELLFTDVILPGGMNGRQIAERARERRPELKVLFTTGYTRNAIVHHGRLDEGVHLLGKPFTAAALTARVRELLDRA